MPRCACPLLPQQARPRARRLRRGCAPAPHRPSVASVRRTQETRLAAPGSEAPRTTPNHPEPPRSATRPRASRSQPSASHIQPLAPHLRRTFAVPSAHISWDIRPSPRKVRMPRRARPLLPRQARPALSPSEGGKREAPPSPAGKPQPAPTFSAAPTSAQPPFSSRSHSPWHTAPRRWCGCHGRDTAAGRARFGRGRIRSG